jgi:hypothetical protein
MQGSGELFKSSSELSNSSVGNLTEREKERKKERRVSYPQNVDN